MSSDREKVCFRCFRGRGKTKMLSKINSDFLFNPDEFWKYRRINKEAGG
jgi:hypothetical protein